MNFFCRCFTCCLFLTAQSTLATNLMHERMAPCTPPLPALEEGVLQPEERIVAATFPNSRGMRALLVEKSDEIRLVLVDAKNKLIQVKSEGRCHVNIGNAREIMWVDDDTVFTGFSGRIWSEYHVIQLSMNPNGAYWTKEILAGHLQGNEDYATNGDSLLLLCSEKPSYNGRLPLQHVNTPAMDVVGWEYGWILKADGQGAIDMFPAVVATEWGIPTPHGPFFRPGLPTRIDWLPLPGFAQEKQPFLSGGWAYIYPDGTPPTEKKQIKYHGSPLPVLQCSPRADAWGVLHAVVEYQGKPCLASLRMPSNAGVCYLGELPELATAPVPLEELPGSEITSLINLGEHAACLCSSQQWLVLDTKTGKLLLRGFREKGRPEPIAVGSKLYEFDPNTITFTLLLDISQP